MSKNPSAHSELLYRRKCTQTSVHDSQQLNKTKASRPPRARACHLHYSYRTYLWLRSRIVLNKSNALQQWSMPNHFKNLYCITSACANCKWGYLYLWLCTTGIGRRVRWKNFTSFRISTSGWDIETTGTGDGNSLIDRLLPDWTFLNNGLPGSRSIGGEKHCSLSCGECYWTKT